MKKLIALILALTCVLALCACAGGTAGKKLAAPADEKGFAALGPDEQEENYEYRGFFAPAMYETFVGDTMPYYEDGTYYIYYLKQGGNSFHHSIFLATTTDFVHYTEYDDVILESNFDGGQDGWVGTGSVCKVGDTYYFFYTAHASESWMEYQEKIYVATSTSLTSAFTRVADWELIPDASLGQKNDFRDPQAYYDPASGTITLTVTAAQGGVARILKYTLSADLSSATYDGIIFTDPTGDFWNLECSDTFQLGNKYYLTYSGQDDTLWYAVADAPYGPYGAPTRLDGKLFYAAKHVESPEGTFMVGWARRSSYAASLSEVAAWAGNLAVQKLTVGPDGESLVLEPVAALLADMPEQVALAFEGDAVTVEAGSLYHYVEAFTACEGYRLSGKFTCAEEGVFGLAFDYDGKPEHYKLITLSPAADKLSFSLNEGTTPITETALPLTPGQEYSFTFVQEGSVGIFYVDGAAALTVRLYGVTGKPVYLWAERNSVAFTELAEYTRG
ncbi:MAG: hypothetical protein ACSW8F_00400 [bacterium]